MNNRAFVRLMSWACASAAAAIVLPLAANATFRAPSPHELMTYCHPGSAMLQSDLCWGRSYTPYYPTYPTYPTYYTPVYRPPVVYGPPVPPYYPTMPILGQGPVVPPWAVYQGGGLPYYPTVPTGPVFYGGGAVGTGGVMGGAF